MGYYEKPAIKRQTVIWKCVLGVILGCIAVFFLLESVSAYGRYREVVDDAITIQAVITHVEVDIDVDNGDTYDAMMRYEYDGVVYTDIYKNYGSEREARSMVNKTVTIQVDPGSPGDTLEEINSSGDRYLFLGAVVIGCLLLLLTRRHREDYVQTYGWNRETVKKDLVRHICSNNKCYIVLIPALVYYAVVLAFSDVYRLGVLDALLGGTSLIAVWFLLKLVRRMNLVRNDRFYLCRDTLINKEDLSDSDSSCYRITYQNSEKTWHKYVSYKVYMTARVGDTFESARLEGEKAPVLTYSHNTGAF